MSPRKLEVQILGDSSGAKKAFNDTAGAAGRMGASLRSSIGGAAKFAAKAFVGVGVAGVGAAVGATKAAVAFESDMANVFTLLPGISGDAMGTMNDQVLEFSKELGILPAEVVPALYDALSAGVPKDNVFEFMAVAGKAAIGGNLEIADSVDLLSTAVNAYAATGLSAAEASDIFFTTVRLGKTTVPELQGAFSQIGPIAAALGISLEEVGASISTLTASGVPTKQAANQMKAALAELGKTGSKAAIAFEEMAGISFTDMVAEGGDLEGVMDVISASGVPVIEMFSSIEAAQGVLGLVANEGEAFSSALGDMRDAAGATDAAFGTMDATAGRSMDKIKANLSAVAIELGNKLLPAFQAATDWAIDNFPAMKAAVLKAVAGMQPAFDQIRLWVGQIVAFVVERWPQISEALRSVRDFLVNEVAPRYVEAVEFIWSTMGKVVDWVIEHWPQISATVKTVIDAVVTAVNVVIGVVRDHVIPAFQEMVDSVKENWPEISAKATEIFGEVSGAVEGTVNFVRELWRRFGTTILEIARIAFDAIRATIENALQIIGGTWNIFKGLFTGDWGLMWTGIKDVFGGIWSEIENRVRTAIAVITTIVNNAWDPIMDKVHDIQNALSFLPGIDEYEEPSTSARRLRSETGGGGSTSMRRLRSTTPGGGGADQIIINQYITDVSGQAHQRGFNEAVRMGAGGNG